MKRPRQKKFNEIQRKILLATSLQDTSNCEQLRKQLAEKLKELEKIKKLIDKLNDQITAHTREIKPLEKKVDRAEDVKETLYRSWQTDERGLDACLQSGGSPNNGGANGECNDSFTRAWESKLKYDAALKNYNKLKQKLDKLIAKRIALKEERQQVINQQGKLTKEIAGLRIRLRQCPE